MARTVLLVLQHSDEGTYGVILNRPAKPEMREIWKKITGDPAIAQPRLALGGTKGGPVIALHHSEFHSEFNVEGNLHLSRSADNLKHLARERNQLFKIFLGIVEWKPGELEEQIEFGRWYVTESDNRDILGDVELLWEESICECGDQLWRELLGRSSLEFNGELN